MNNIIRNLFKLANDLDASGLVSQADVLDKIAGSMLESAAGGDKALLEELKNELSDAVEEKSVEDPERVLPKVNKVLSILNTSFSTPAPELAAEVNAIKSSAVELKQDLEEAAALYKKMSG